MHTPAQHRRTSYCCFFSPQNHSCISCGASQLGLFLNRDRCVELWWFRLGNLHSLNSLGPLFESFRGFEFLPNCHLFGCVYLCCTILAYTVLSFPWFNGYNAHILVFSTSSRITILEILLTPETSFKVPIHRMGRCLFFLNSLFLLELFTQRC